MAFRTWGGKRKGAGRPPKGWRSSELHKTRQTFATTTPLHVTLRVVEAMARLRRRGAYHAIRKAMQAMFSRPGFRIVHISIEYGHIHLIVEAESSTALARGMQSFQISAAKRLNASLGTRVVRRCGQVFADRYHAVPITSPTQARNAIGYLLGNWRKHGQDNGFETRLWEVDYYSSGPTFGGWEELRDPATAIELPATYQPLPVIAPTTWLLAVGWRKAGPLSLRATLGPRHHR